MKVKRNVAARDRVNFFVPFRSVIGLIDQHDLFIQHPRAQRSVEKRIWLFLRNQPVQAVGQRPLDVLIVLLPDADDQVVRKGIAIPDKIQLLRPGLTRMPQLI